ncbi:MAG: NnrS family protein [Geminicoccaceae bacterium]
MTVLHLGYAWLGAGLLLLGLGILLPHSVGRLATLCSAGAIGTMTLAIMTCATLGHTGRALAADRTTVAVYALVQAGALLRVVALALPSPGTRRHWPRGAAGGRCLRPVRRALRAAVGRGTRRPGPG